MAGLDTSVSQAPPPEAQIFNSGDSSGDSTGDSQVRDHSLNTARLGNGAGERDTSSDDKAVTDVGLASADDLLPAELSGAQSGTLDFQAPKGGDQSMGEAGKPDNVKADDSDGGERGERERAAYEKEGEETEGDAESKKDSENPADEVEQGKDGTDRAEDASTKTGTERENSNQALRGKTDDPSDEQKSNKDGEPTRETESMESMRDGAPVDQNGKHTGQTDTNNGGAKTVADGQKQANSNSSDMALENTVTAQEAQAVKAGKSEAPFSSDGKGSERKVVNPHPRTENQVKPDKLTNTSPALNKAFDGYLDKVRQA